MTDLSEALPPHLRPRCRPLNASPVRAEGAFVVYWLHHAARGHENPALDVALVFARALGLPVLVYQGLGGGHRHDSDRHHRFILEGAREVRDELRARRVRHAFHLPRDPRAPSPLRSLVQRAAAVVCEDFPAPPFPGWTAGLARRAPCAVFAVDAACVVPQGTLVRRPERAYAFRDAVREYWEQALHSAWPEQPDPERGAFDGDLGFAPFDLDADLDAAIAGCAIDHGVGPVAHTPGGSRAGYARWERFRVEGLADYARLRNDAAVAWPRGVSRMSPYLHHGMVSPLRIAREARATGGAGAEKFLDELLVWRELAFHWCAHTADPESLDALPAWARDTLAAHAHDPRRPPLAPGQLDRAASGHALWDAAQDALRRHGELHNNLRMTWGKAIVGWTAGPREALATLVELNHRYALDGNDPASYGGLLWCLGLFDRPFAPERAVLGSVRPRDPDAHAQRLDLDRYRQWVGRPAGRKRLRVAVVGAGMAGAAAARVLDAHGHAVTVFEKSRGAGGRMATRRDDAGAWNFGAPAFDASDPRFRRQVDDWRRRGVVRPREGVHARLARGRFEPCAAAAGAWVGSPAMNAPARDLLDGIALRAGVRIAALQPRAEGWSLHDEAAVACGEADAVVVAVPPAQAVPLLASSAALRALAGAADMQPCWTVRLRCAAPPGLPFDSARIDDPVLAECSSAGGRCAPTGNALDWVLHADPGWSAKQLEVPAEHVVAALVDAWRAALGRHGAALVVAQAEAHRWRYARPVAGQGPGFGFDASLGIALAGDWLHGPGVQDAWLSGVAAAGAILRANASG
jgi:photolyase PhrII